jgi:hypothetical protein
LLGRGKSAEEVVAPDRELDTEGVEVPPGGQVEGFDETPFNVAKKAGRP